MELRNLARETQRGYLTGVKGLAQPYHQSPGSLTKDEIEDHLLPLKNEKGNTTGRCGAVAAGWRFFYTHVTEQPIPFDCQIRRKNRKLPTVLSQEDIWKIINATKHLKHRLIHFMIVVLIGAVIISGIVGDVEGTVALCLESRFLDYQEPHPPFAFAFSRHVPRRAIYSQSSGIKWKTKYEVKVHFCIDGPGGSCKVLGTANLHCSII